MAQESPNAWKIIPITLPLARKTVSSDSFGHSITIKPELNGKESKSRKNE
jgi:hypothetical protein